MTACANENLGEKLSGRKVVSATLAGVLAAGMMPAVALADEAAADTQTDDGIDLLSLTTAEAFKAGKVTAAAVDGIAASDLTKIQIKFDDQNHKVVPTEVTPKESKAVAVADDDENYSIDYYKVEGTTYTKLGDTELPKAQGNYVARVTALKLGTGTDVYVDLPFSIVANSLEGITVYNGAENNTDTSKTDFTFDNDGQIVKFALNGKALTDADIASITYRKAGDASATSDLPKVAGDYTAFVTGKGAYANSTATATFTISPLDLSKAKIVLADRINGVDPAGVASIDGNDSAKIQAVVDVKFKSAAGSVYTYSVTPKEAFKDSVKGSQDVSVDSVKFKADFNYGTESGTWPTSDTYNLSAGEFFDVSKIFVSYTDGSKIKVDKKNYEVTVTDADGKAATTADLKKPGTWYVDVKVDAAALDYAVGGNISTKVVNISGEVGSADVVVKYKGNVTSPIVTTYNGSDVMDGIEVVVKDADGNALVEGTDYEVKYTDTTTGKEVTEMIDAGSYAITVKGINYEINDGIDVTAVTINKIAATQFRISNVTTFGKDTKFVPYTGKAIVPVIEYNSAEAGKDAVWVELPSDTYKLAYEYAAKTSDAKKSVDEMLKVGYYDVTVSAAKDAKNYSVTTDTLENVWVSDAKVYADVPSDAWFAEPVYKAATNGYMTGYYGTKFFGAYDRITRADVACVLFNMAGGKNASEGAMDEFTGYVTKFSDVDKGMYYSAAIGWAAKAGVVNGYTDGTYKPEQNITREEFAAMLANYAKAMADYEAVDTAAVLLKFDDGNAVSDWAKDVVAWAADRKVMGNGGLLMPTDTITRAEVAAMAVNYQPKPIETVTIPTKPTI